MSFIEIFTYAGLTILGIGSYFVYILIISSKKAKVEIGQHLLYSERCGGRFGFWNYSFPFVRLAIYQDFMVISCTTRTILEYNIIRRVESTGIIGTGIKIITNDIDKYGHPIILTFNKRKVLNLIKERMKNVS